MDRSVDTAPPNDPRVTETVTTIEPSGANLVSKQTIEYDDSVPYNNPNKVKEYDFGATTVVRETRTTYVTSTTYTDNSVHVRSLPSQISIYNGSGVEQARTTFEYDVYSGTSHAALQSYPRSDPEHSVELQISGMDSGYTAGANSTRGNVTATTNYLLLNGSVTGSVTSYAQYDVAGNVIQAIDAKGYSTTIDYTDRFGAADNEARSNAGSTELNAASQYGYAFPTSVTNHLGHTAYAQFDYYVGKPVNGEDANGIISSGYYNDFLDRPRKIIRAVNGGASEKGQTIFDYDDSARIVTTTSDQKQFNDSTPLKTQTVYDGLGRTIETRQYETANDYIAVTQVPFVLLQDGSNWFAGSQSSNPYRPYLSEQPAYTKSFSDALGRVVKVKTPDNASVVTSYSGNTVTVTDQAGKTRKSVTDALGRLKAVYEDPAGLNYLTSYSYDTLDNLISINQGGQWRYFMYDSLKRLVRARNPEQDTHANLTWNDPLTGNTEWSLAYGYDNNGNLTAKVDARNITTTYVYDALNRVTSRSYSDSTPGVAFAYDSTSITNGKGRLASVGSSVSSYTYTGYDAAGRSLGANQVIGSQTYSMNYTYDVAGHVKSMTYPSGHAVNYNYDRAGRLNDDGSDLAFTGNLGNGVTRTYSSAISYSPFGGFTKEKFSTDTPVYNKRHYNVRGQLYDMRASTVNDEFDWNRGAIVN